MGRPSWGCIIFLRLNENRNRVCIERHYIFYYGGGGGDKIYVSVCSHIVPV